MYKDTCLVLHLSCGETPTKQSPGKTELLTYVSRRHKLVSFSTLNSLTTYLEMSTSAVTSDSVVVLILQCAANKIGLSLACKLQLQSFVTLSLNAQLSVKHTPA